MPRPSRRNDLIETAQTLFNAEGFHAVGIERILSEGNLAKMTLYRHFPSKNALILGVLEAREKAVNGWFQILRERGGFWRFLMRWRSGLKTARLWANSLDASLCGHPANSRIPQTPST